MLNRLKIKSCLIISLLILSCIEEFDPHLDKYENILVVDGMLSSAPGPHKVKLSLSTALNENDVYPVAGANLHIVDQNNNKVLLEETDPGLYQTIDNDWTGVPGNKYKLVIITKAGDEYQSSYEELKQALPIDSIYGKVESIGTQDLDYPDQLVYQFYINNENINLDTAFFLWSMVETYQYEAPVLLEAIWDGYRINEVQNKDTLLTCWKTEVIPNIYTGTTKNYKQNKLIGYPLNTVLEGGLKMKFRYSMLITQYILSENSYNFWNSLNEQNNETGLYTSQPYQIRGNIINISNPEIPVLGNFTVAGATTKRIMVSRQSVFLNYVDKQCTPNSEKLGFMLRPGKTVFIGLNEAGQQGVISASCFDCRQAGGTLEKPSFW